jgi:hypothetical protein
MFGIYRDGMAFGYSLALQLSGMPAWTGNASGNRLAMRFVAELSVAPAGIALRIGSVTGSPQQQDVKVSLWTVGTNGLPGTQLEERDNGSSSALSSNSRLVVGGWTTNLSAGQEYFIVVRNGNGSPTTNYFQVMYGVETWLLANEASSPPGGSYISTDSGGTWTAQNPQRGNYQIIYNTGSGDFTYGWLIAQTGNYTNLNNNPTGVRFNTPAGIRLRVIGVGFAQILLVSNSSWAIRIKQQGNTIGTTIQQSRNTSNFCFLPFPDVVVLEPDTQTDVEAFLTSGTSGAVRRVDVDTTLTPIGFPFQYIENGNVVSGRLVSVMKLILDPRQPFDVVGSGGGQPLLPPMPLVQTFM